MRKSTRSNAGNSGEEGIGARRKPGYLYLTLELCVGLGPHVDRQQGIIRGEVPATSEMCLPSRRCIGLCRARMTRLNPGLCNERTSSALGLSWASDDAKRYHGGGSAVWHE